MSLDAIKLDIITKIRDIALLDGKAPGREKFQAQTGIKPHVWRGRIWRNWTDALVEAGFAPNEYQAALADDDLLRFVAEISKMLGRFPSTSDIEYELPRQQGAPNSTTILSRWKMPDLAGALADFARRHGEHDIIEFANAYVPSRRATESEADQTNALGYVYMQRHGGDYKIGFTKSLNKRGRQIQIELPQEIELVHSILTDDPAGVEYYWHRRFADKRTRGEWFKLTNADVVAFKKWSKIW
jgi:hypothetical protein